MTQEDIDKIQDFVDDPLIGVYKAPYGGYMIHNSITGNQFTVKKGSMNNLSTLVETIESNLADQANTFHAKHKIGDIVQTEKLPPAGREFKGLNSNFILKVYRGGTVLFVSGDNSTYIDKSNLKIETCKLSEQKKTEINEGNNEHVEIMHNEKSEIFHFDPADMIEFKKAAGLIEEAKTIEKKEEALPAKKEKTLELKGKKGDLRFNLQWGTIDDLDIFVEDVCSQSISFFNRTASCSEGFGELDIDANIYESEVTTTPQENIYFNKPPKGKYVIKITTTQFEPTNDFYARPISQPKVPFIITIQDRNKEKIIQGTLDIDNPELIYTYIIK